MCFMREIQIQPLVFSENASALQIEIGLQIVQLS